jgi:glutamate-ammonia-ligase adenylyltransferase
LNDTWPQNAGSLPELIENFPLGERALLHLLATSRICAARLIRNPAILQWLARPEICLNSRGYGEMLNALDLLSGESVAALNFRALRVWKHREMTRIALRELANAAPLEETTAELSQVAEICVAEVYKHCNARLRETIGSPGSDFAVLALGKLGGRELNHSSDVDLLFLYADEGHVGRFSHHEWYNRLGEKIVEIFSIPDPEGPLLRIDLRLRPEGSAGPLARSLEGLENYYAGFGETWERLALIKARGMCGSRELAYEFLRQLQPFIYPKSPTPDLLDEIAAIKRRIEREVAKSDSLERDVKLGCGGIREIEFVVQTLQFIHGARHTFLQDPSTLSALRALARLELIPRKEVLDLDRSYRFLRQVEHRLQIDSEQQTHTVPRDQEAVRRLALSLGFSTAEQFTGALNQSMQRVRAVFQRIITQSPGETKPIDLSSFADEKRASKALSDLASGPGAVHFARRTRQVFRKLRPLLLDWLAKVADPDAALNQFVRFVEAYGLRGALFESLVTNPKLLELLIKTLDASRFAGDLLIRRPQLLDELTRDETFGRSTTLAGHLRRLELLGASATNLDPIRAYRQAQLLRIVLRDVLGLADRPTVFAELSNLAEAGLIFVNNLLGGGDLTIVGLGKFGGGEINYGADLDVLFVGKDVRAAQNLIAAMSQPSSEGIISTLDIRLRPDGEKGPLVCSLAACENYYRERAQLWEIQALTRARPVSGAERQAYLKMAQSIWHREGKRSDLLPKIDDMLKRIRRERGSGSDFHDFKTGSGGMIEAEFLVQALQMKNSLWNQNWSAALTALARENLLTPEEAESAIRSYDFLRRCETILRRWEIKSVSTLPTDSGEQNKLVQRLGFSTAEEFGQEYGAARGSIYTLYQKYIQGPAN